MKVRNLPYPFVRGQPLRSIKCLKEELNSASEGRLFYHPIMPSMTTLSDNKQSIMCTEHLRGQVLIKSSVKKKNITVNKEKHFTNCCKEITQGLMGFCAGKTAGCSNSRRICHCLNRIQKGCRKWFKA